MNYSDHPDFNNYLDEKYEEIHIENFISPASLILFQMDIEAYIDAFNAYLEEQKEIFPEKVMQSFPAPIAFYFERTYHGYENNIQRLHLLRSTWESVIYILYAIAIGEIIDKNLVFLSDLRVFSNSKIKLTGGNSLLSDKLGYKLEVIEKILEYNSINTTNLIIGEIIPISVVDKLRGLNNERNSFSHIAALDESQAEERCHSLIPEVINLLFELKRLEFLSLIQYKGTRNSVHDIRFWRFEGHSLKKRNHDLSVDNDFIIRNSRNMNEYRLFCQFIFNNNSNNSQIICLSPFVHGSLFNNYPHILFYKKQAVISDKFIFEIIADSPCEIEIEKNIFDNSIQALEALLS